MLCETLSWATSGRGKNETCHRFPKQSQFVLVELITQDSLLWVVLRVKQTLLNKVPMYIHITHTLHAHTCNTDTNTHTHTHMHTHNSIRGQLAKASLKTPGLDNVT